MMVDNVEYKPIPKAPVYGISKNGDVIRFKTGHILKPHVSDTNSGSVKLWYEGRYHAVTTQKEAKRLWEGVPQGFKSIPVEGLENYLINDRGEVYSTKHTLIKKQNKWRGWFKICLWNTVQKKSTTHWVHRLVALTFIGDCPDDCNQINHIDGDKTNNHYSNLEWCDGKHNMRHASKLGLMRSGHSNKYGNHQGEKRSNTNLTDHDVIEMRRWHFNGRTRDEKTWERYGICASNYYSIVNGKKWKHLNSVSQTSFDN